MILYTLLVSYCINILGSILMTTDKTEAEFQEKMVILDRIHNDCYLPLDLYT